MFAVHVLLAVKSSSDSVPEAGFSEEWVRGGLGEEMERGAGGGQEGGPMVGKENELKKNFKKSKKENKVWKHPFAPLTSKAPPTHTHITYTGFMYCRLLKLCTKYLFFAKGFLVNW